MGITVSSLLTLINGPQEIMIYDIDKDEDIYNGPISGYLPPVSCREVKSIDPVEQEGPRAGILVINI